jgi:hypothetical protein
MGSRRACAHPRILTGIVTKHMRNEVLAVSTQQGFREFLAAHHDSYRAVRFDATGVAKRSHSDAVERLDRLIKVWQARTALPYGQAQQGLHHWGGFRAAQAYVAEFVSLWEGRQYGELDRRLDSEFRLLGFEFSKRPGEKGWHHRRSYPISVFHGDIIVIECLLELYTELGQCLPRASHRGSPLRHPRRDHVIQRSSKGHSSFWSKGISRRVSDGW